MLVSIETSSFNIANIFLERDLGSLDVFYIAIQAYSFAKFYYRFIPTIYEHIFVAMFISIKTKISRYIIRKNAFRNR